MIKIGLLGSLYMYTLLGSGCVYIYIYTHTLYMFIGRTDLKERSILRGK